MLLDDYLTKYDKQIDELAKLFHVRKNELIHEIKEIGYDKSKWEDNPDDAVWLERDITIIADRKNVGYPNCVTNVIFKINLQIDWNEQENEENEKDIRHFYISLDTLTDFDTECYNLKEDFSAFDIYRKEIKEYLACTKYDTFSMKFYNKNECFETQKVTREELSAIANNDNYMTPYMTPLELITSLSQSDINSRYTDDRDALTADFIHSYMLKKALNDNDCPVYLADYVDNEDIWEKFADDFANEYGIMDSGTGTIYALDIDTDDFMNELNTRFGKYYEDVLKKRPEQKVFNEIKKTMIENNMDINEGAIHRMFDVVWQYLNDKNDEIIFETATRPISKEEMDEAIRASRDFKIRFSFKGEDEIRKAAKELAGEFKVKEGEPPLEQEEKGLLTDILYTALFEIRQTSMPPFANKPYVLETDKMKCILDFAEDLSRKVFGADRANYWQNVTLPLEGVISRWKNEYEQERTHKKKEGMEK